MVQTLTSLNEQGETDITICLLLLDHAMIAEGQLKDPAGFAQRLQALMAKGECIIIRKGFYIFTEKAQSVARAPKLIFKKYLLPL